MLFYNSVGPNPRVVRMFLAEKGLSVQSAEIDLIKGENRRQPYLSKNPHGQMSALELDDGTIICEITAICEYLEEMHPSPPLMAGLPGNGQKRACGPAASISISASR